MCNLASPFPFQLSTDGTLWCCGMAGCTKQIEVTKKSLIVYHKNTHFPKYICEHCNEAFPQKSRLDTHVRTAHTGEKPYKCDHCERAFPQLSNLNDHVRKHHPDAVPAPKPAPTLKVAPAGPKPDFARLYAEFREVTTVAVRQEHPDWTYAEVTSEVGRRWREHKAVSGAPSTPRTSSGNECNTAPVPRENPGTELPRIPTCEVTDLAPNHAGVNVGVKINIIFRRNVACA